MTSQAKILANRRNAKKSTGPRTKEGKRRAAMNALKHGMTAKLALMQDEDQAGFERRMREWVAEYGPRTDRERFHVESAVYRSWQLQRTFRAHSAGTCHRAETALDEKLKSEKKEAVELSRLLYRRPGEEQSTEVGSRIDAGKQKKAARRLSQAVHEQVEDPALLVLRLESSEVGCQWLLEKWKELLALLEEGQSWKANERFMALRMLRLNTLDVMHAEAITSILQACQALEPGASGLVEEFWNELVAAKEGWSLERLRGWMRETPPPADEAAARLELIEIVQVEVATLEETLKELEENAAVELKYFAHRHAVDFSPEGVLTRRYEATCQRYVDRYFRELDERKNGNFSDYQGAAAGESRTPTHARPLLTRAIETAPPLNRSDLIRGNGAGSMVKTPLPTGAGAAAVEPAAKSEPAMRNEDTAPGAADGESRTQLDPTEVIRGNGAGSAAKTPLPAAASAAKDVEPAAKSEPPVQNEAAAAGTSYGETLTQMTAKTEVTPNTKTKAGGGSGRVLRNEAKAVAMTGPHRGISGVKAWDNSRRARRARAANERASGSGAVPKALNFTGPRARNLLIPVELTV